MAGGILLYGAAFPAGGDEHAAAHALLAAAVREGWGWTDTPPMARGKFGKPYFPDLPLYRFNLSHTAGLCLCALSDVGEVGVDIERVRPRRADLPKYVLSDGEYAAFHGGWDEFYRIWTLKEAFCKLRGRPIWPAKAVPVPPPSPYRSYAGGEWCAALCAEGGALPRDIVWRF